VRARCTVVVIAVAVAKEPDGRKDNNSMCGAGNVWGRRRRAMEMDRVVVAYAHRRRRSGSLGDSEPMLGWPEKVTSRQRRWRVAAYDDFLGTRGCWSFHMPPRLSIWTGPDLGDYSGFGSLLQESHSLLVEAPN